MAGVWRRAVLANLALMRTGREGDRVKHNEVSWAERFHRALSLRSIIGIGVGVGCNFLDQFRLQLGLVFGRKHDHGQHVPRTRAGAELKLAGDLHPFAAVLVWIDFALGGLFGVDYDYRVQWNRVPRAAVDF